MARFFIPAAILVAFSLACLAPDATAQALIVPRSFTTCASQLNGARVSDTREALEVVNSFADSLHQGVTAQSSLEPGHYLFCRDDLSVWHQITPKGVDAQPAMLERIAMLMSQVDGAARILQVDSALKAALAKRGLGEAPSVVSVGRLRRPLVAVYSRSSNLLTVNVDDEGFVNADILVHEALGHLMFHMSCAAPKVRECKADPATLVWTLFTEADAFAKQIAYAIFVRVIEQRPVAWGAIARVRGFDSVLYMQIAEEFLRDRQDIMERMRRERRVPKELLAHLVEHFCYRPPANYLESATAFQKTFGSARDIEGSLESIIGYLDDEDRKRINKTFRASPLFLTLGEDEILDGEKVRSLMKAPAP